MRRMLNLAAFLLLILWSGYATAEDATAPHSMLEHVKAALKPIEATSKEYLKQRECFSCHHQAMPIATFMEARRRGISVDEANLIAQVERAADHLRRGENDYRQGKGQGGAIDTAGYAMQALSLAGHPRDSVTDSVVEYLLRSDAGRGRWKVAGNRPPTQSSDLSTSTVALLSLIQYRHLDVEERVDARLATVKQWYEKKETKDNEERAFKLFGCKALGLDQQVQALRDEIIAHQRSDGGWAQLDGGADSDMQSDAYATGSSLVALAEAGVSTDSEVYRRGLKYLIESQLPDGTWHVKTRSKPIQTYFESGFPHGADQFISTYASCWATLAMLRALPLAETVPQPLAWHEPKDGEMKNTAVEKPATSEEIEFFEKEVRPVLALKCAGCHGSEKQSAELRVDSIVDLLSGGESGPAIIRRAPDRSLLMKAVERKEELKMPPDDPLAQKEIDAMRHWIEIGAPWPAGEKLKSADARTEAAARHWAFQPLRHFDPPMHPKEAWNRGGIDAFVVAKLHEAGLSPAAEASKRHWLRRVTYDLTGLPPSNEAYDAFESNSSPDAYDRTVERLLASPRFGEHWARHWLDVARYSDTKGYVYAREERFFIHAATYRDWVVQAFSEDMPYDRFVKLQLAADQAAPEDKEAQAAMGFITIGRRFLGVTPDIVDDRIDVVTRGLLGLTAGCARCHDHKFDPIPTNDYYSLYGVFHNSIEKRVRLTSSSAAQPDAHNENPALTAFETELAKRDGTYRDRLQKEREACAERVRGRIADYLFAQTELDKYPFEGFDIVIQPEDMVPAQVRRVEAYLIEAAERNDEVFALWRALSALPATSFEQQAPAVIDKLCADSNAGIHSLVKKVFRSSPPKSLREAAERYAQVFDSLKDFKASDETEQRAVEQLQSVLTGPNSPFIVPDEDIVSIEQFFPTRTTEEVWKLQGEVDRWINQASPELSDRVRYAVTLGDRLSIREPHVFRRGNPRQIGDRVPRQFLAVLTDAHAPGKPARSPFHVGSGRLELAEAITDPRNPLTARVWVNRVWQHLLGQGIVTTPSDFGLRASAPSHAELLDRLAEDFVAGGWDSKALIRKIVLSGTYRQAAELSSPEVRSQAERIDPDNRLLWRANTKRLTFEQQRDTWLAVSGAIDLTTRGKARDLFPSDNSNHRRSLYGLVDRQFLLGVLRVFDFANPDLHIPQRSETTVPQQALFSLNHPFTASVAQSAVKSIGSTDDQSDQHMQIRRLYRQLLAREPSANEVQRASEFLSAPQSEVESIRAEAAQWSYGYGDYHPDTFKLVSFKPLPHFNGNAWQGGPAWPDGKLGWAQLTATGGHAGNDLQHAVVRRWTAPAAGIVRVRSSVRHETSQGDGIRFSILTGEGVKLDSQALHNNAIETTYEPRNVKAGESLDFIVDIHGGLNNDQFLWNIVIDLAKPKDPNKATDGTADSAAEQIGHWESARDFSEPRPAYLSPWEQLAQVLLLSNELQFVD